MKDMEDRGKSVNHKLGCSVNGSWGHISKIFWIQQQHQFRWKLDPGVHVKETELEDQMQRLPVFTLL